MKKERRNIAILFIIYIIFTQNIYAQRIKDIANIEGVSEIQVIGYGLVTGLNQTGDNQQTSFTVQSVSNMLKRFGITVPQLNPRIRNVAAVMVTARIKPFYKTSSKVDVEVSSIGDATSLQGGVLLMTPMYDARGNYYGMAQGPLSVGGYDYRAMGSRVARNTVTTGRVPNGLILETQVDNNFDQLQTIRIVLKDPDFTTASRIAQNINTRFANSARAIDGATIEVNLPTNVDRINAISQIESIPITPDPSARVVINERTGTIVVGGNVRLLPAVIAHGGLEISIQRQVIITQPAPFTIYPPQSFENAQIIIEEQNNAVTPLNVTGTAGAEPTVQDMANALNLLRVSARDLIAIFQALKEAGSLQGELIIQ